MSSNNSNLELKLLALQKEVSDLRKQNIDLDSRLKAYSLINTGQVSLINKLVDRVPFGIIILDENNIITRANAAAGKIFSTSASRMEGQPCVRYFKSHESLSNNFEEVNDGEVALQKIKYLDTNKYIMHSAFVSDEGSKKITVETFIDITEIKQAEQELININQAKGEFLGMISHELRTPLNVIQGYSSLLEEELSRIENKNVADYVSNIAQSGEILLQVINKLLDLSNLTAGKVHVDNIPIDVNMIVTQLEYRLEKDFLKNGNKLSFHFEEIPPFEQDLALLMKIFHELLVNANKFTEKGEVDLSISLFPKDGVDWLSFKISDTGCGMTDETMKQIFSAFHQADASLTRAYEGLGLGLSLVEKMVKIVNGYIDVKSELGKGAVFNVCLPYQPAAD